MTLAEMIEQVKADLDIDEASSIGNTVAVTDTDITSWINRGIRKAEGIIHTIYEDYFLSYDTVTLVANTNTYDYPSDIYANKIRKLVFGSGSEEVFEVKRVKDLLSAQANDILNDSWVNPVLTWTPLNTAASGRKMQIFPKQCRNGTLHRWYIRNAAQLSQTTDECDIDEFVHYVVQYAKVQALLKDRDPAAADEKTLLDEYEEDMKATLSEMSPDENNTIPLDVSFYKDSVG